MSTALFPGSFDPFTLGHLDVLSRACALFDRTVVAVGRNAAKTGELSVEERLELITTVVTEAGLRGVEVAQFSGLTIDFAVEIGARWLIRGLRGAGDLDAELAMAATNRAVESTVDTVFLPPSPQFAHVHARWVREMHRAGRDLSTLVPPAVARALAAGRVRQREEGKS